MGTLKDSQRRNLWTVGTDERQIPQKESFRCDTSKGNELFRIGNSFPVWGSECTRGTGGGWSGVGQGSGAGATVVRGSGISSSNNSSSSSGSSRLWWMEVSPFCRDGHTFSLSGTWLPQTCFLCWATRRLSISLSFSLWLSPFLPFSLSSSSAVGPSLSPVNAAASTRRTAWHAQPRTARFRLHAFPAESFRCFQSTTAPIEDIPFDLFAFSWVSNSIPGSRRKRKKITEQYPALELHTTRREVKRVNGSRQISACFLLCS